MSLLRALRALGVPLVLLATVTAQVQNPVVTVPNPPNTPAQQKKHYVILVSLDGFRFDYPTKFGAPNLLALAHRGASAPEGMLPSYPSLTFPNHLTLVTGLYPEHHGIVANSFWDPTRKQTYVYKDSTINSDGTWYSGTPLWSLAQQQGMRAASFFWPGSEAEIAGQRPTFYLRFDDKYPDPDRIEQIVHWLQLPPAERPHFITLYYSNVDHAGHAYGPDAPQTRDAVHHLDDMIGLLEQRIASTHLPIDLVIVADHGMIATEGDYVTLDQFADLTNVRTEGDLLYASTDAEAARILADFQQHPSTKFHAVRRADVPAQLHFDASPREGDPVIIPDGAYPIRAHADPRHPDATRPSAVGEHGYDPRLVPEMKAIFFAAGPDVRNNVRLQPFENTNVYNFICALLGLKPAPNDGHREVLAPALKHPPRN